MIELTLPDMTCQHCVQSVTKAVQKLDAAAEVTCDLPTHGVKIQTSVARERIVQALAMAGYVPEGPTQ